MLCPKTADTSWLALKVLQLRRSLLSGMTIYSFNLWNFCVRGRPDCILESHTHRKDEVGQLITRQMALVHLSVAWNWLHQKKTFFCCSKLKLALFMLF